MKSLLDIQNHIAELKQKKNQAINEGNFIKRDIINTEIKKAEKLIDSWGTKPNTIYRIM